MNILAVLADRDRGGSGPSSEEEAIRARFSFYLLSTQTLTSICYAYLACLYCTRICTVGSQMSALCCDISPTWPVPTASPTIVYRLPLPRKLKYEKNGILPVLPVLRVDKADLRTHYSTLSALSAKKQMFTCSQLLSYRQVGTREFP